MIRIQKLGQYAFLMVQIAAICVFLGRGWQFLFFDAPYRALFWDEKWMSALVTGIFDTPWKTYATSPQTDHAIQNLIRATGILYFGCALIAIWIKKLPRFFHFILLLGALNLFFLAFLYTKEKFFHTGQFFEYTLQFSSPVFLYLIVNHTITQQHLITLFKIAIALTFTCHGLYALGYYPRPESFMTMTLNITGLDEAGARSFLSLAALLDFMVAVGLFVPVRKVVTGVLVYAAFWGFATSVARIWGNFYLDFWQESLHLWTYQCVFRLPHGLIPLGAIFLMGRVKKKKTVIEKQ